MRIEPDVTFPCPIYGDPFRQMAKSGKLYGFTIANKENRNNMPSLWPSVRDWLSERKISTARIDMVSEKMELAKCAQMGDCCLDRFNFMTNFELASFSLWRSDDYVSYFEYLDKRGGFFYERWTDASVHSFYLFSQVSLTKLHHFADIGYGHEGRFNWPATDSVRSSCRQQPEKSKRLMSHHACLAVWNSMIPRRSAATGPKRARKS